MKSLTNQQTQPHECSTPEGDTLLKGEGGSKGKSPNAPDATPVSFASTEIVLVDTQNNADFPPSAVADWRHLAAHPPDVLIVHMLGTGDISAMTAVGILDYLDQIHCPQRVVISDMCLSLPGLALFLGAADLRDIRPGAYAALPPVEQLKQWWHIPDYQRCIQIVRTHLDDGVWGHILTSQDLIDAFVIETAEGDVIDQLLSPPPAPTQSDLPFTNNQNTDKGFKF